MDMKLTDDMLYEHAEQARDLWLNTLPEEADLPEHVFSESFLASLTELERQKPPRKKPWRRAARRVAAVFLVILAGSGTWLSVDADARAALVSWFRETTEDSVVYGYVGQTPSQCIPDYHCSWLPEGIEAVETEASETSGTVIYMAEDDRFAVFSYSYMHSGTVLHLFASEQDLIHTELEINGMYADFYEEPGDEYSDFIIWFDENSKISFDLLGNLDKADMIRMAQNVEQGLAMERMPEYICTWLPQGYQADELTWGSRSRSISCLTEEAYLYLDYAYQDGRSAQEVFSIENTAQAKTVTVWGQEAVLYPDINDGESCLIWADAQTGIAFCLESNEPEATMLRVAEAIEPKS